jgi:ABC-2 type transport system permease protein
LSLGLALLLPIASLLLFGFGIRLESKDIPTAVIDSDDTSCSRAFIQRLFATETFNPTEQNDRSGDPLLTGSSRTVVHIPHGFAADLNMGRVVNVLFTIDGTALTEAHTAAPSARAFGAVFSNYIKPPDPRLFYVIPRIVTWFNPDLKESLFIVSGVFGVVLFMFPSLLAAVSMSRDFEHQSVVQPFSANLSAVSFLLGKLTVYLSVGICQAIVITTLGCMLFGLRFADNSNEFPICTVVYLIVSVLFGMLMGLVTNSQTTAVQATSSGGFFSCMLLSGYVYPLANIPFPLSLVSYLVPARYYIHISRDAFIRGAGWEVAGNDLLALVLCAVILFGFCWLRMKDMRLRD